MNDPNAHVDGGVLAFGFPRDYEAWLELRVPERLRQIHRATGQSRGDGDGFACYVAAERMRGWPLFLPDPGRGIVPSLFSTPDPDVVGIGLIGDFAEVRSVRDVRDAVALDAYPVRCGAADVAGGRFFLASDLFVFAYGAGGRKLWQTRRVAIDGIAALAYRDGRIEGTSERADFLSEALPFTIDPDTGEADGGFEGWDRVRFKNSEKPGG